MKMFEKEISDSDRFDLIIIGSGAVGSATAFAAARKGFSVCVIEKNPDVCFETSGRNSGVVHAGFNNKTGSLKAKYCVKGSKGFESLAKQLDIPYKKTGKYVVSLNDEDDHLIDGLIEQGIANGVNVSRVEYNGRPALFSPDTAVTDPFRYTTAMAEAAYICGCRFLFQATIRSIDKQDDLYRFTITFKDRYGEKEYSLSSDYVINCAGLGAADICAMVGIDKYKVMPCRGEYHIIDPCFGSIPYPVYPAVDPAAPVLGIHLTPTIDGNIMIGPSSEYLDNGETDDYSTTADIMDQLFEEGRKLLPGLTRAALIRSFSGNRPKLYIGGEPFSDFLIDESLPRFINLLGIESPGLTASMPLAEDIVSMIDLNAERKVPKPATERFPYERMSGASNQICRCEQVTANDILSAYDRIESIGAVPTLKGIKNRTRLGMGRCQGSFCTAEVIKLLRRERGVNPLRFTYQGDGSHLFTGMTR